PVLAGPEQISGKITDALGRPVAQVQLELRNGNGSAIARATTDQAGRFKIAPAKPGVYSLEVVKAGFKSATKIVLFPPGAGAAISITLETETALTLPVQASLIRAQNGVSTTGANKY